MKSDRDILMCLMTGFRYSRKLLIVDTAIYSEKSELLLLLFNERKKARSVCEGSADLTG
jgi:hypothetical protein